nr:putative reverse transcriptase domain-containing protein [Tanacetum cinerariifolium]
MSTASFAVTYTSVYTDFEPGKVFWGADKELSDGGYVAVSNLKEGLEEYEDEETEDGLVDYPIDGGDDDDSNSSGDDADDKDKDEEEEEDDHLALVESAIVIPTDELVAPPKGTEPVIPPPSTDTATTEARITIRLQAAISFPPEAEETIQIMKDEAYVAREAWAHSIALSQTVHSKLQTHQEQVKIMAHVTRQGPSTLPNNTNPNNMTPESVQAKIDQTLLRNFTNGDGSHSSHEDNRRNVQTTRPCFYADFMKCQPLNFKGTKGMVSLTRWIEKMESVFQINGCDVESQVKFATCTLLDAALTLWNSQIRSLGPDAYLMTWEVPKKKMTNRYCPQGEIKKLKIELWNLKVKENNVSVYTERFQELTLICTKFVGNETEKIDKYVSRLPDNIYVSVKASKPKTLDETIELANDLMDQKLCTYAERSSGNANVANTQRNNEVNPKGNGCFECGATWHFKRDCPKLKNKDGEKVNVQGWLYAVGNAEKRGNASRDPDSNVVTGHPFNIDLMPIELGSFDVIIDMDCLRRCYAVIVCDEKLVRIPYGNETMTFRGNESNNGRESRLTNKKEHKEHLKAILELLKKEKLYAKFSKGKFWIPKVQFLGNVIDSRGIHVDPANIESIKDCSFPKTPTEIRQFLGLDGYYQRFIEGFLKIAKSKMKLTQKGIKFDWGKKEENAFQLIKQKLYSAPTLALPEGSEDFVFYCDASRKGLDAVLMQREKLIAYVS